MTVNPPLLVTIERNGETMDAHETLAGLAELRRRIRRRASWPWRLVSWSQGGRRAASILGVRARIAVHAQARGPIVDLAAGKSRGGGGYALVRAYGIGRFGSITLRFDTASLDEMPKPALAELLIDIAERAIRASIANPDPTDLMAGLAILASRSSGGAGMLGWMMPTPFSPFSIYEGGQVPTTIREDVTDLPHALILSWSSDPDERGFDLSLTPMFVGAFETEDVVAAMRQFPIIEELGSST